MDFSERPHPMTVWPRRMNSSAMERPRPRETPGIRMIFPMTCGLTARIKLGFLLQLFPQFFLALRDLGRNGDFGNDEQIAFAAEAAATDAKLLAALSTGGNFDLNMTV